MPKGKAGPGGWADRAVAAAKAANVPVEGPTAKEAEQQELLKQENVPVPNVVGDQFCVRFVKPAEFEKEETDRKVGLEFSTGLSEAHDDLLDSNIVKAIAFMRRSHVKTVGGIEIPNQTIYVRVAPDIDNVELRMIGVEVRHVNLTHVVEKGSRKETRILRLQFRAIANADKNVMEFARTYFDESVWIQMQAAQGVLKEQKDAAEGV